MHFEKAAMLHMCIKPCRDAVKNRGRGSMSLSSEDRLLFQTVGPEAENFQSCSRSTSHRMRRRP